jgi:hypothetical protein
LLGLDRRAARYSRDSSQRTGSRPRGKIVLRRESPNRSLNGPSLNDHCETRSRRSNGKVLAWIRLGCNTPGTPSFQRVPFFSPETPHSMVCDTVDACKIKPTLCRPRPDSTRLSLHRLNSTLAGCLLKASKRGERPGITVLPTPCGTSSRRSQTSTRGGERAVVNSRR